MNQIVSLKYRNFKSLEMFCFVEYFNNFLFNLPAVPLSALEEDEDNTRDNAPFYPLEVNTFRSHFLSSSTVLHRCHKTLEMNYLILFQRKKMFIIFLLLLTIDIADMSYFPHIIS